MSKTKDLEPLAEAGGDLVKVSEPTVLLEILRGERELETVELSSEEMTRRILAQLEAQEDVWAQTKTWNAKDNVGRVFTFHGVSGVYPSKYTAESGERGVFVAFNVSDENGEVGVMPTSAMRITTRLAVAWQRDELPVTCRIVERGQSSNGYAILDVEKLEEAPF